MKILIVEDEKRLAEALSKLLEKKNYSVDIVHDGQSGLDYALSDIYDLIILDIMLPIMDGLLVLREIRKAKINTPIFMLTAKGEVEDRVKGLDYGADDYLAKPFASSELLARIRVLLRRKGELLDVYKLEFGNITLNHEKRILCNSSEEIVLTQKEADIIELFIMRKSMVVTKELLIEKFWGFDSKAEYNNVEVYISFLRKKLNYLEADIKIKTIRSVGYSLEKIENV